MQVYIRDAYKEYDGKGVLNINEFTFSSGKIYVILGLNGSGKSTLLNCIAGIGDLDKGSITYNNLDINNVRRDISLVTQKPYLFNTTVFDNIIRGLKYRKADKHSIERLTEKYSGYFQIDKLMNKNAKKISVGEMSKTAMLRAAVLETSLTLLDEPTAAMDVESTLGAEKLIRTMVSNNRTVIMITHDLYQAQRVGDYIIFINKGEIIEEGSKAKIFTKPEHPIVKAVLNKGNEEGNLLI